MRTLPNGGTRAMKKRRIIIIPVALIFFYLAGPFLAGAFRVGYRMGPAIYPESFHATLYIMAHESIHNEKPRQPLDDWMYRRPVFYGLSRRLKSEKERKPYIEMARRNQSPRVQKMMEQNKNIQDGK